MRADTELLAITNTNILIDAIDNTKMNISYQFFTQNRLL